MFFCNRKKNRQAFRGFSRKSYYSNLHVSSSSFPLRVSGIMVSIVDCGSIDPCSIHGLPKRPFLIFVLCDWQIIEKNIYSLNFYLKVQDNIYVFFIYYK